MSKGIDYGLGQTNIDRTNGIRYGVINQNEVLQAWADSSEANYGDPCCPECGNELTEIKETSSRQLTLELDGTDNGVEVIDAEYECSIHGPIEDNEDIYSYEALSYYLDDGEYKAECGEDGDIFIVMSPFYTRAQFCSPCAPGACYLTNPCEDGERAYCFGHDWFEDGTAPYPVYRVSDNSLVEGK